MDNKKIICVVPARLGSTRFPRKMVALLENKPLVQWAYEGAVQCGCFDEVVVAVDGEELYAVVTGFGGRAVMTSMSCLNGTERLAELQRKGIMEGDIWVCWQGDEPFIQKETIHALLQTIDHSDEEIWTLKKKIYNTQQVHSPNVVKVVSNKDGKALYFSRSPIPYSLSDNETFYKHVGIYAYRDAALKKIGILSPVPIEEVEKLEQLRFLYHGMSIRVHETNQEIFGIDTKEDLDLAQQMCYTPSHYDNRAIT